MPQSLHRIASPQPLSLEERLRFARARVRTAQVLAELNPGDRVYEAALSARASEENVLRALIAAKTILIVE